MRLLSALVTLVALPALAATPVAALQAGGAGEWVLRPGDALRVEFLTERVPTLGDSVSPSGARVYDIDDEGMALLPVAGLVRVAGRPFARVREEVAAAFAREFVDGVVRLTPLLRVAVLGEVRTPGLVPADPTMALADILAAAGGLTPAADRGDIRLVRSGEEDRVVGADEVAGVRVPLRSGDRVVVGRRSWAAENTPFLLGAGASVLAAVLTAVLVR